MNEDLKKLTPEQLAEALTRAAERCKDIAKKQANLIRSWKVERTINNEEFKAYSDKYQEEFSEASAEEQRIWKFIHNYEA